MKKPTPRQRELLEKLAGGARVERTSAGRYYVGSWRVHKGTFDACYGNKWLKFDGMVTAFSTAFVITDSGREAIR